MGRILLGLALAALLLWASVAATPTDSSLRWVGFLLALLVFVGGIWLNNARR